MNLVLNAWRMNHIKVCFDAKKKTWWGKKKNKKQRLGSLCAWQSANVADGPRIIAPDQCRLFTSKVQSPGLTCINNPGLRQKCSMLEGGKVLPFHFVLSCCIMFSFSPAFEAQRWERGRQVWAELLSMKDGQTRRTNSCFSPWLMRKTTTGPQWDVETLAQPSAVLTSQDRLPWPGVGVGEGTEFSSGTLCTLKEQQPLLGW